MSGWIAGYAHHGLRSESRQPGRCGHGGNLPLVAAYGLVGHIGVVAAAHEQTQCTLPAPVVHGPGRRSLGEQGARGLELRLRVAIGEHLTHELGRNPPTLQTSGDPLLAPAVESPPIFDETAREAGVVEVPAAGDLGQRRLGGGRLDASPLEERSQLGGRVVAPGKRPPGEHEGPPVPRTIFILAGHGHLAARERAPQAA